MSKKIDLDKMRECYENGGTDIEAMDESGMTKGTFYELYDNNPDFRILIDTMRMKSQAWWVKQARLNLWSKEFNHNLWAFNMKNRYGWADKVDQSNIAKDEDDFQKIQQRLVTAIPQLAKALAPQLRDADVLKKASEPDECY